MANTPESKVSRRTLAKGAAWAVPVIAGAAAAPQVAASTTDTAPTNVTITRTCAGVTVKWAPKEGVTGGWYQIEAFDGTDWRVVATNITGTSYDIADSAHGITQVRVTHFVSADAYSVSTDSDVLPAFTTPTLSVDVGIGSNRTWTYSGGISGAVVLVLTASNGDESTFPTTGTWAPGQELRTNAPYKTAHLRMCGVDYASAGARITQLQEASRQSLDEPTEATRAGGAAEETTKVTESTEAVKQPRAVKPTESPKPTADAAPAQAPQPAAEPKPAPAPSPTVEPVPVVTEAAAAPAPAPSATPSA